MEFFLVLIGIIVIPVIMFAIGAAQFAKAAETFRSLKK